MSNSQDTLGLIAPSQPIIQLITTASPADRPCIERFFASMQTEVLKKFQVMK
jgi:hypothetical protein